MTIIKAIGFFLILMIPLVLTGSEELTKIDQWKHDEEIYGFVYVSAVDVDGNLVVGFLKTGLRLITPKKMEVMAPFGQGEGDIQDFQAAVNCGNDIAIVELPTRAKVFTLKEGKYKEKKITWFKRHQFSQFVKDGLFVENKWFLAGLAHENPKERIRKHHYVAVLDEAGQPLASLVKEETEIVKQYHILYHHLTYSPVKGKIYHVPEDKLKLSVICPRELKVIKEISLETPDFYKPPPAENFSVKLYHDPSKFDRDVENWKTNYSRITDMVNDGNYLVLQIRTANEKLKNFALLFYDLDQFKLQKTIFIDDYLLGAQKGKYYFYANGNPTLDEDTDTCTINIYSLAAKK